MGRWRRRRSLGHDLYVGDHQRSVKFYQEVLGFPLLAEFREGVRGFERIEEKLLRIGADIRRLDE